MGGAKDAYFAEQEEQAHKQFLQELIDGQYLTEPRLIGIARKVIAGGIKTLTKGQTTSYRKHIEPFHTCDGGHTTSGHPCPKCERDNAAALDALEEIRQVDAVAATLYGAEAATRGMEVADWDQLRERQSEYTAKAHKLIENGLSASPTQEERIAWNVARVLDLTK